MHYQNMNRCQKMMNLFKQMLQVLNQRIGGQKVNLTKEALFILPYHCKGSNSQNQNVSGD
jgi:hypothetical protein